MHKNKKGKRILLNESAYSKLLTIRSNIENNTFGNRVSVSALCSQIIDDLSESVIKRHTTKLSQAFFDPVAALRHAATIARKKEVNGESADIKRIVNDLTASIGKKEKIIKKTQNK